MAYPNYFPNYPYGYNYPQPTQQMPQSYGVNQTAQPVQQTGQSGIIWVQGEAGAKSYMVPPGSTVQLWDSEAQVIYVKSADASGMPSMKIIDYKIRDNTAPIGRSGSQERGYATKEDVQMLQKELDQLRMHMEEMMGMEGDRR